MGVIGDIVVNECNKVDDFSMHRSPYCTFIIITTALQFVRLNVRLISMQNDLNPNISLIFPIAPLFLSLFHEFDLDFERKKFWTLD